MKGEPATNAAWDVLGRERLRAAAFAEFTVPPSIHPSPEATFVMNGERPARSSRRDRAAADWVRDEPESGPAPPGADPEVLEMVATETGLIGPPANQMAIDVSARVRSLHIARLAQRLIDNRMTVTPQRARNLTSGGSWALDVPERVAAVWGHDDLVGWSSGEPFFLVGPPGVGKTTLLQQLILARVGLRRHVLGMPVAQTGGRVLCVFADRPPQAQRSLARMVSEDDRALLDQRLVIWRGALPFDLALAPAETLATFAEDHGADTILLDSPKDVATMLVEDEGGLRVNNALQATVNAGKEVGVNHHQRKEQKGGAKPKNLSDVYGSVWLTAGAGSVVLLWGDAGDLIVELSHLKQPVTEIGPMKVLHDSVTGTSTVLEQQDVWSLLSAATKGLTPQASAVAMFETPEPDRNQIEKARRRLDSYVRQGRAHKKDAPSPTGGKAQSLYFPIDQRRREGAGT